MSMRALIFDGPGEIRVGELDSPRPGPGEAVLDVAAASVCASDLRVFRGEKHAEPGIAPGHEFAGVVSAVGEGVADLAVGDRVAVYPIIACGGCLFCRRGLRNRCVSRRTLGYDLPGGMAEQVLLPAPIVAQGHAVQLSEGAELRRAALTEPTACVLNSLESCRFRAGCSVAVLGTGPMGLLHVALARALGAGPVIAAEPTAPRRAAALQAGADAAVEPDAAADAVAEATRGAGADVVIVSVGLDGLTEAALPLAARQGAVNLFAGFPKGAQAAVDVNALHYNEVTLTGTQNATPDQFRRTAALIPSLGALDEIVTHRFPLPEAERAYSVRADPSALKTMVTM